MSDLIEPQDVELLKADFDELRPFGPAATRDTIKYSYLTLYHPSARFEKAIRRETRVIFGRRGSGKSSLVERILRGDDYKYKIVIKKSEMVRALKDAAKPEEWEDALVENVATLWCNALWLAVLTHFRNEYPESFPKTNEFLNLNGIAVQNSVTRAVTDWIRRRAESKDWKESFLATLGTVFISKAAHSFEESRDEVLRFLGSNSLVVLIDSLEDYKLGNPVFRAIIAGLLPALYMFSDGRPNVAIKCFFPAESFGAIRSCSKNNTKDFENIAVLQWTAGELHALLCRRLMVFYRLYDPSNKAKVPVNTDGRLMKEFWQSHFPAVVTNQHFDVPEDPTAYIFRHSQLLPRQLILIGNAIAGIHGKILTHRQFSSESVRNGVRSAERDIATEVFNAFAIAHPDCEKLASQYLRNFEAVVSLSDVDRVRSRLNQAHFPLYRDEHDRLLRMLVEVGVFGRHCQKLDTDRYGRAVYQYYLPRDLMINDDDQLLAHPIFVESYGMRVNHDTLKKPVLPIGALIEENPELNSDNR